MDTIYKEKLIEFLESHKTKLIGVAKQCLFDKSYAEDVYQDVVISALRVSYPECEKLQYAIKSIRNQAGDYNRKHFRASKEPEKKTEFTLGETYTLDKVRDFILEEYSPKVASILIKYYFYGSTLNELSLLYGMPINTVSSHVKRGKDKIIEYFRGEGNE